MMEESSEVLEAGKPTARVGDARRADWKVRAPGKREFPVAPANKNPPGLLRGGLLGRLGIAYLASSIFATVTTSFSPSFTHLPSTLILAVSPQRFLWNFWLTSPFR